MHQFPFMVSFAGREWNEPTGTDVFGWHPLDRLYRGKDGWFYVANGHRFAERSKLEEIRFLSDEVGEVSRELLVTEVGLCLDSCGRKANSKERPRFVS